MDQPTSDKLKINITNSWKMLSVQFIAGFSAIATAAFAWYQSLPADCALVAAGTACTMSQASILAKFGVPALFMPMVAAAVTWYLRVRPQANITPAVALAKSTDAPQPPAPGVDNPAQPTKPTGEQP